MKDIPFIAFEAGQARYERIIRRLWISEIILIGITVTTAACFIIPYVKERKK